MTAAGSGSEAAEAIEPSHIDTCPPLVLAGFLQGYVGLKGELEKTESRSPPAWPQICVLPETTTTGAVTSAKWSCS